MAIHRIEASPNFVIYTGDEGAKLFEDAVGDKLKELYANQSNLTDENIKKLYPMGLTTEILEKACDKVFDEKNK